MDQLENQAVTAEPAKMKGGMLKMIIVNVIVSALISLIVSLAVVYAVSGAMINRATAPLADRILTLEKQAGPLTDRVLLLEQQMARQMSAYKVK